MHTKRKRLQIMQWFSYYCSMLILKMYIQHLFLLIFYTCPVLEAAKLFRKNNACTSFHSYPVSKFSKNCYYNPNVLSNVEEMVIRNGYNVKSYAVTTDDGYILTVFRVSSKNVTVKNPPIFIQHGLATNCEVWVHKNDQSLAFQLVDMGYDVWLGNSRGNTYSRKHIDLKISNPEFWEFNLDTMAKNDISSQLKFVAKSTGNCGNIIYVGHSQGTTLGYMYCSEYAEEAQSLLQGLVTLAPIVYLDGAQMVTQLKTLLSLLTNTLESLEKGLFYHEDLVHKSLIKLCRKTPHVCYEALEIMFGKSTQFLPDDLLLHFSSFPAGASIYQFKQFLQINKSGRFQKYDYGKEKNYLMYGTTEPPVYNLSNINIPTYMFYGKSDSFHTEESLEKLFNEIGSDIKMIQPVPLSDNHSYFNHIDFYYAKDIKKLFYENFFDVLNSNFGKQNAKCTPM